MPLLTVAQVAQAPLDAALLPRFAPTRRSQLRLCVAPQFAIQKDSDYRPVTVGEVAALVPGTMLVIATRLGPPNPWNQLAIGDRLRFFVARLPLGAIGALTGAQGLARRDVPEDLQPLFDSLIPSRLRTESSRLRLNYAATIRLTSAPGNGPRISWQFGPEPQFPEERDATDPEQTPLASTQPNRTKPSDLDYASLTRRVSLTGATTLREALARVAKATGRELHADGRLQKLALWCPDRQAVPAGELLKALALSVTGTFRRVDSAYVLTDDREGLGTRYARLNEWGLDGTQRLETLQGEAGKALAERKLYEKLRFAPNDPLALDTSWKNTVRAHRAKEPAQSHHPFDLGELPTAFQSAVTSYAQKVTTSEHSPDTATVGLNVTVYLTLLGGDSKPRLLDYLPPEDSFVEELLSPPEPRAPKPAQSAPTALPAAPRIAVKNTKVRLTLQLAATSPEEATRAVQLARSCGFTQLWLRVPLAMKSETILRAGIKAGSELGVHVGAALVLFRSEGLSEAEKDRNILGESWLGYLTRHAAADPALQREAKALSAGGDWRLADTPARLDSLRTSLIRLATTPGLSELALNSDEAPGYGTDSHNSGNIVFAGFSRTNDLGYSPTLRLAFLRAHGYDPLDLIYGEITPLPVLPFFPWREVSYAFLPKWLELRHAQSEQARKTLEEALATAAPSLLQKNTEATVELSFLSAPECRELLNSILTPDSPQDRVLDFSALPLTEAQRLIESVFVVS